jgi:LPXTG-motif cell wall-anchored protein
MRNLAGRAFAMTLGVLAATVLLGASPAQAAPALSLSKSSGLKDGDRITVNGTGFKPNLTQIAIGQCIAEVAGPTDCHLGGGAQFVNADASGKIPEVTLKLAEKFGTFDCTKRQCVIAAQVLPSGNNAEDVAANKVTVRITFGTASQAPTLPKTGPGDEYLVITLAGSALLLCGIGFVLLLPRRWRGRPSSAR